MAIKVKHRNQYKYLSPERKENPFDDTHSKTFYLKNRLTHDVFDYSNNPSKSMS